MGDDADDARAAEGAQSGPAQWTRRSVLRELRERQFGKAEVEAFLASHPAPYPRRAVVAPASDLRQQVTVDVADEAAYKRLRDARYEVVRWIGAPPSGRV